MALAANSVEGKSEKFVARIENLMAEGETAKSVYMSECKQRRGDIKEIYTEAKDAGVPLRALKGLIKYRDLERRQNKIADGFEDDDAAVYENLVEALGELGAAAARAAGYPSGDDDDERDLRPDNLKDAEKERADEAALAGVGHGKAA